MFRAGFAPQVQKKLLLTDPLMLKRPDLTNLNDPL